MRAYKLLQFFSRQIELENIIQKSALGAAKTKQKIPKQKTQNINLFLNMLH